MKHIYKLKAFAKLFARKSSESRSELLDRLDAVSPSTLQRSRVRVDCLAMFVFQKFLLASLKQLGTADFYLYCDGSPQWRGVEVFASSMDVIIDGFLMKLLLPLVSLTRERLDRVGKTVALLWQMVLVVGSSLLALVCQRVRCIITDNGTERLIVGMPNFLEDFFEYVHLRRPKGV